MNLSLCYSSFELIRQRLNTSKQKQKFEDMENFMNFLGVEDEEDEQSCNEYQLVGKSVVCNEELDYKERDKGSQINASYFSNSEISSQEERFCLLDSIGEKNDISAKAYKEGEVLNSEILNEIVDMSFEISHDISFPCSC